MGKPHGYGVLPQHVRNKHILMNELNDNKNLDKIHHKGNGTMEPYSIATIPLTPKNHAPRGRSRHHTTRHTKPYQSRVPVPVSSLSAVSHLLTRMKGKRVKSGGKGGGDSSSSSDDNDKKKFNYFDTPEKRTKSRKYIKDVYKDTDGFKFFK